jgi:hypothetical protein
MRFPGIPIGFSRCPRHAGVAILAFLLSLPQVTIGQQTTQPPGSSSSSPRSYNSATFSGSSSSRSLNSSSSRSTGAKSQAAQSASAGAAKKTVVRRKAASTKTGSGGAKGIPLPRIKMLPSIGENALYFHPSQMEVGVGDRFATDIEFYNVNADPVDAIDLWIKFNPAFVEPVWIDVAPIADQTTTPVASSVWREQGYIRLQARLKSPLTQPINAIAQAHWRGLTPTPLTRIDLAAPEGQSVAMFAGGRNVVALSAIGNRSRVGAVVSIASPDGAGQPLRMEKDVRGRMTAVQLDPQTRVRLAIVPSNPYVGSGEVATADVVLINPNDEPLDTIRFRIRYDPTAVKILDADENNYITGGINISDGGSHDRFPFDYQGANAVNPGVGTIDYAMGTLDAPARYSSGTVARIVYRMLREAGQTAFWFERADPLRGSLVSDVSANGVSLLGPNDKVAAEALHGTRVMVRPLELAAR